MGIVKCFWCKKEFDDSFKFCPYCGKEKEPLNGMRFEDTTEIEKVIMGKNVIEYRGKIREYNRLLELVDEKDKNIFERQKDITEKFLNRFPQIKDKIEEKEDVKFYLFVVSIPYLGEGEKYQHDCILQKLARKQSGIVNLSLNIEEISSNLYSVELPIWTDDFSEREILEQYNILNREMPHGQNLFTYSIEPWYFLNRIYEFNGRWIDWKVVFEIPPRKLERFINEEGEVPLNFQNFTSLRYSDILSTAGTATDGETLIGIIEEDELDFFDEKYDQLKNLYHRRFSPQREIIEISWDTLKELGFLYKSIDRVFKSNKHIFSRSLGDLLIKMSEEEFAKFTRSANFGKEFDEKKLTKIIVDRMCDTIHKTYGDSTIGIHEPIPRIKRYQYRITGGAYGK